MGKSNSRIVVGILATLAVACVILGIWLVVSSQGTASTKADPALQAGDRAGLQYEVRSSKLANATETVDGDGIVHGTTSDGIDYVVYGRGQSSQNPGIISFAAVGDVFATNMNMPILETYGKQSGIDYDFEPYYRGVKDEIESYDLRFINQETPCAGNEDGYSYSTYPIFNTPDSSVHALANVGFNIANFNSNHSWDMDEFGIERTQSLFAQHPSVMLVGSYASQAERDTVHLVERDGATIAVLSYAYGDNMKGSDPAAFPNQYYTCQFDKDVMRAEIERAKQVADAVVVYMHWGTEYTTAPNEQQLEYAQFLADLDVDLVIGSHAHIMQPIRYYNGPSGKSIPVVFGLSDFITGWTLTDTILSGMFTCDFSWKDGALTVSNCAYTPAIEWSNGGDTYVRFLKDMSNEELAANTRTEDVEDDVTYLRNFIDGLDMEVPVVW